MFPNGRSALVALLASFKVHGPLRVLRESEHDYEYNISVRERVQCGWLLPVEKCFLRHLNQQVRDERLRTRLTSRRALERR